MSLHREYCRTYEEFTVAGSKWVRVSDDVCSWWATKKSCDKAMDHPLAMSEDEETYDDFLELFDDAPHALQDILEQCANYPHRADEIIEAYENEKSEEESKT